MITDNQRGYKMALDNGQNLCHEGAVCQHS